MKHKIKWSFKPHCFNFECHKPNNYTIPLWYYRGVKKAIYRILQFTWGLPQSLVGLALFIKYKDSPHHDFKGSIVTNWPVSGGISLGMFTFVENKKGRQEYVQNHEYGHTLQSLILGPLYLFLIGIPSYTWANLPYYVKKRKLNHIAYNSFIVEKTADILGGNHMLTIGMANDHAGTELKFKIMDYLQNKGYKVVNYGTDTTESCDFPEYGERLAMAIKNKECDFGIAICGTGVGISIACNKVNGIRCGVCSETKTAGLIREHNDAQIIAFGARVVDEKTAYELVDTFLSTPHDTTNPRHDRRIAKLKDIEDRQK